jgi:hypothetical protein
MEESFKTYEKTIKHSFGWTPKFEDEFRTNLNGAFIYSNRNI